MGAISKFEVFYSWPAFFARMTRKAVQQGARHPRVLNVRICYNRRSGLNIVPVDYVAKAMYLVCDHDHAGSSYHLANDRETPHEQYIPQMLETLGVSGVSQVDSFDYKPRLDRDDGKMLAFDDARVLAKLGSLSLFARRPMLGRCQFHARREHPGRGGVNCRFSGGLHEKSHRFCGLFRR